MIVDHSVNDTCHGSWVLTPSMPAVTNCCCSKASVPCWSNRPFFTVRLHVMQRTVLLLQFCPPVCLSVRCVYCDKTKQRTANIMIPHETAITLVFWHQQWLLGNAPFPLKSALKVTRPPSKKRRLRPISTHNVSTVGDSEKVQLRWI